MRISDWSSDVCSSDLSWTTSPDGLTWTFKLRQGVDCHGKYGEFDAEDAVFSLKRAAAKESSSFAKDYAALQTIEATGKYEVKIVLANPIPSLLGLLVPYPGGNMVCKDAVEDLGAKFERTPIGTGPFMFAESQPQHHDKLGATHPHFPDPPH